MTLPALWGRRTTLGQRGRDLRDALFLAGVGMLLIAVGLVGVVPPVAGPVGRWWFVLPLAALCALVLLKRRRPLMALAGGTVVLAVDLALGGSTGSVLGFVDLVLAAALYAGEAAVRRLEVAVGVAVVASGIAAFVIVGSASAVVQAGLLTFAVLGTPLWWGSDVRRQTEVARLEAARADDASRLVALRAADATHAAREAVAADLHDALAGDLAAIAIHSEAALAALGPSAAATPLPAGQSADPSQQSLAVIRSSSTSALTHLREMVVLLRSGASAEPAPRRLTALDDLVRAARSHGLDVVVEGSGCADGLPDPVDLVAGRIVAEALTNAVKHAPGAGVRIVLADAREGGLRIEVVSAASSGPAAALGGVAPALHRAAPGVGVVLMRERAASLGGALEAGPVGDAWVVAARLPLAVGACRPANVSRAAVEP